MEKLYFNGTIYQRYTYVDEKEFEKDVIERSNEIFGKKCLYIDIKKKIQNGKIGSIPDGYLIDFTFENEPKLYLIENELERHELFRHIGAQMLKFASSSKNNKKKIKDILIEAIESDEMYREFVEEQIKNLSHRNIDAFLEKIVYVENLPTIIVIDKNSEELETVLNHITMETQVIEFQAYKNKDTTIYKFDPLYNDLDDESSIIEKSNSKTKSTKGKNGNKDTIIIPANADGFEEVFIGENAWYAIKISLPMHDRIKYIAAYQTSPVSAVTYYAEVSHIEKYENSGKHIVYFKNPAIKLDNPILLPKDQPNLAPQSHKYTTFEKLMNSRDIKELFNFE